MNKKLTVELGPANYRCMVRDGQHQWYLDEPVAQGGSDTAPDPLAALLASLGSCSAITLRMYAERKGWPVTNIIVEIQLEQRHTERGKVNVFNRDVRISGPLNEEQLLRLHQIVRACPISRILEGNIAIETTIDNMK
jgi:putative redox protein